MVPVKHVRDDITLAVGCVDMDSMRRKVVLLGGTMGRILYNNSQSLFLAIGRLTRLGHDGSLLGK